jgi:hypothetical protein
MTAHTSLSSSHRSAQRGVLYDPAIFSGPSGSESAISCSSLSSSRNRTISPIRSSSSDSARQDPARLMQ